MLPQNSYGRFDEGPEYKARASTLRLSLSVEIIERLLHGLSKLLLKFWWIQAEEFPVESMDYSLLI